ncbi:tripartite tricarboxylate transporter substrate binding protein [Diaphorobacter sp. HDW4A]|uniref:Bug family tripartite tricarboxylate transporter substrate binding protein n=1 Tax=Diaphorobacter sp. HDW4A TaxID=2714924 RepID=UPI00140907F0|nr:tripartite tricarboxylate transporter substrate binding protein [Diaphorobacter sp. HDW4A]QIL79966.1 tripartite tricarboxylate transporter substrate binding protein [Diaphorobacter sp. HDW4A]
MLRKDFLKGISLAALSTTGFTSITAWAQTTSGSVGYPTRSVKLIVASAAGSSPDAISRQVATQLSMRWNQPVVIENVPGLGGITGTERGVRASADGYNMVVSTIGAVSVGSSMMEKLPYDPVKDLAPVTMLMSMPNLLVIHPSVPAKNLKELIAYARQNKGKLRYGHPGAGTTPHLSAELLKQMTGIEMEGIPYKSSAQMMTDLLAGHYEVLFHNSSVVLPHARAGGARIMGITSAERVAVLPEIPTVAEAGGLPGFTVYAWWGLHAPANTPPDIVNKVSADVSAVLAQKDITNWIEQQGGIVGGGTPQALKTHQAAETLKWRDIVKNSHIKPD